MNDDTIPRTPLQQALAGPGARALWLARRERLLQLQLHCRVQLAAGLAPADYAGWQRRLAMCEAAERVLETLEPPATAEAVAAGPAAGWPTLVCSD